MSAVAELTGIVPVLDESTYHSHPALSSTGARQLLDSPARFHYAQSHPQPHKDAFDLGTAVHTKVLGVGHETIVLDFPDYRTKAARDARDEARAAGLVAISPAQARQVDAMAEAVLAHPVARALFEQSGTPEASVFATDPATGVDMRARFDYLPDFTVDEPWCVDLKTTGKSASPDEFTRTVASFGYDVQQEWYLHAYGLVTGEFNPRMKFVVVETAAPHLVAVHELSDQFAQIGAARAQRARETYAECSASGEWPGYPEHGPLEPPMWLIYEEEEDMGMEISI